jgi:hypothetical protein
MNLYMLECHAASKLAEARAASQRHALVRALSHRASPLRAAVALALIRLGRRLGHRVGRKPLPRRAALGA